MPHDFRAGRRSRAPRLSASSGASARRVLGALFSSSLGVGLIFGFQPPLVALVLSREGASSFAIGAVTAVSLIAVILLGPFYPGVIRRLGLKGSIVAGIVTAAVLLLLMGLWPRVSVWMSLRFLSGCVLGLAWISSEIWMNVASDEAARGRVMGVYGTVFSIGVVSGPVLLEITGTRGFEPFACGAAFLVLTLLPLSRLPPLRREAHPPAAPAGLARTAAFAPVVMIAALVAGLVESADLALLPVFGLHAGLGEREALLLLTLFMIGNVLWQTPIGMLADRFGRRALLALCAALSVLGPLLLPVSIGRPAVLGVLLFVWGGTLYAFYSLGVALLGEAYPATELAAANTVFVMVYCIGGVIGPSLGGFAMDAWPRGGLITLLSAAPALLLMGLAIEWIRRRLATPR
jgi:MFS family permease